MNLNRTHDWFKTDLPEYLFPPGGDVDASIVDTEAIHEVCEVIICLCFRVFLVLDIFIFGLIKCLTF